jgi:hypothetical protein
MFLFDVTRVQALPNRHLDLTFENGFHGVVEMDLVVKNYIGVFAPLLQDDYFKQVTLNTELGTVVWPNGADLCPDVLYSQATGIAIIDISREELQAELTALSCNPISR